MKKSMQILLFILILFSVSIQSAYSKDLVREDPGFFYNTIGLSKEEIIECLIEDERLDNKYEFEGLKENDYYNIDWRLDFNSQELLIEYIYYIHFDSNNIVDKLKVHLSFIGKNTWQDHEIFQFGMNCLGLDYFKSQTIYDSLETDSPNLIGFHSTETDDYQCTYNKYENSDKEVVYDIICSGIKTNDNNTWTCENGHSGNTGNFCSECGAKRPENLKCPVCGYEPPVGENPKFCQECGAPFDQNETSQKTSQTQTNPQKEVFPTSAPSDNQYNDDIIDPDLKAFVDSYEKCMDKYIDFMKKYYENPTDMSLIVEYYSILSELEDFSEAADRYDSKQAEMSAADLAYYTAVMTRINEKMLSVYQ